MVVVTIKKSRAEDTRQSISDEVVQDIVANSTCTSTAIPTIFGW